MQNWYDTSEEGEAAKWTKTDKAWHASGHLYLLRLERCTNEITVTAKL